MRDDLSGIYQRLYSATLLNLVSDAVVVVALPLALLEATASIELAAVLAGAMFSTQMILNLPLGAFADRLPRRPIVIAGSVIEGGCLAVLGLILLLDIVDARVFIAVGCIRGIASQFGVAASAGYIPKVLGRESLLHYHSRVETIEGVAAIIGPPLAGLIVFMMGGAYAMFLPAAIDVVIALLFSTLPKSSNDMKNSKRGTSARVWTWAVVDIAAGLRYVWLNKTLRCLMLIEFTLGATTAGYLYGIVVHLKSKLVLADWQVGLILTASGVGGIVASFLLERLAPVSSFRRVIAMSLAGSGVILSVFSLGNFVVLLALLLFVLDFCWVAVFIYSGALSQIVTQDSYLARVDSISQLIFTGASALSTFVAGWLVPTCGVSVYLIALAFSALPAIIAVSLLPSRGEERPVST